MKDWADEIALLLGCEACGDIETDEIAAAIREPSNTDKWPTKNMDFTKTTGVFVNGLG